jgi:hypothetical protein
MNNYEADDLIGRNRFKEEFGSHYIFQDTTEFAHTDIMMTACTKSLCYNTEIKNRNYSIDEIADSAILEKIKLDAFREQYRKDCNRCLIYFNYFTDGWVAYDMTNRIRYAEGLNKTNTMLLPATTSEDNGAKEKEVVYLCRTNNMYVQDKIRCYDRNNG